MERNQDAIKQIYEQSQEPNGNLRILATWKFTVDQEKKILAERQPGHQPWG